LIIQSQKQFEPGFSSNETVYIRGITAYIAAILNAANVVKILPVQLEEATDHHDRFKSISHQKR
jgi:hypothetical protein